MLLIEYLEQAAFFLREKNETRSRLEAQYRRIYDRDIKREISIINREIEKKKSEVTNQLLLNLEEFRFLDKYFPELLKAFMEDEFIGPTISKKSWLLNYAPVAPAEAARRLEFLRRKRLQLKDAKRFLRKWVGSVDSKAFCATFPVLKGHLDQDLEKDEAAKIIDEADLKLRKEGWLLLISDSLIKIPISKFSDKLVKYKMQEMTAQNEMRRVKGKGTVAEAAALRKYRKIVRRRDHYENLIIQLLLANPNYLRSLKRNRDWLSRTRRGVVEKIAERVTPHKVKERAWLNEMREKLSLPEEPEEAPKKKKKRKKKTAKKPRK